MPHRSAGAYAAVWEVIRFFATFALGAIVAVFAEPFRRWILQGKLKLEFEGAIGLGTGNIALTPTSEPGVDACYVRVSVRTRNRLTRPVATSCQAVLLKIEKRIPQSRAKTVYHDPVPLAWSYFGTEPRDIPPGPAFYFDVVATDSRTNVLIPRTAQQPIVWVNTPTLRESAEYGFTVAVSGENVRIGGATLTIWLAWKGHWNEFSVRAKGVEARLTPELATSILAGTGGQ